MLSRRKKAALISAAMTLTVMFSVSGCQLLNNNSETESETETETETMSDMETETETETEFQTDVVYISEDESIRIVLPDSTWKVTQDVDEMRVFSSDSGAMINIVHVSDEDSMSNISVMETEDDLEETLSSQYSGDDAFEIISFEERSSSTVETYEYVVKYTDSTSMWAYSVTYGILSVDGDAAYVISGTVTEDDEDLLAAVQQSVESFTVLDEDSVFSVLPGTVENNETEAQSDSDDEDSVGSEELATLTEYTSSVTLYASSNVNIREFPSTDAERVGSLTLGNAVTVTGETSGWFRVSVGSTVGYVSKAYLVSTQPETDADSSDDSEEASAELNTATSYETSYTYYTTASVNVRSQPSTSSSVASTASSGTAVTVTGETDNWYIVSINGTTGYISKAYVSATQPTSTDDSSTSTDTSSSSNTTASGSTDSTASTSGVVSGTITAVTSDTILIYGEDGVTYSVNYANASLSTSGLSEGLYVTATIDYSQSTASGTLYATNVTGY